MTMLSALWMTAASYSEGLSNTAPIFPSWPLMRNSIQDTRKVSSLLWSAVCVGWTANSAFGRHDCCDGLFNFHRNLPFQKGLLRKAERWKQNNQLMPKNGRKSKYICSSLNCEMVFWCFLMAAFASLNCAWIFIFFKPSCHEKCFHDCVFGFSSSCFSCLNGSQQHDLKVDINTPDNSSLLSLIKLTLSYWVQG